MTGIGLALSGCRRISRKKEVFVRFANANANRRGERIKKRSKLSIKSATLGHLLIENRKRTREGERGKREKI